MGKIDRDRLQVIHSSYKEAMYFHILEDTQTGMQYLIVSSSNGIVTTPILDRDGKPLIGSK